MWLAIPQESTGGFMFAWMARKQNARTKSLEAYLSHFNEGELAYLKNLTIVGLSPSAYPADDPSVQVDIATYIHAEWLAASGEIAKTALAKARARSRYRIKLAWDATKARTLTDYFKHLSPHRLDEPNLIDKDEERLGSHLIVIGRLYENPTDAPTLPELEEIGEGRNWLPQ